MPNICNNYVTITHSDPAMIEKILLAAEKDCLASTFLPVPVDCEKIDDWRVRNWGTKWDVGKGLDKVDDNTVSGFTNSAWSPPIGLWEALSEQGYGVHAYWHECGLGFAGEYETGMGIVDYENIEYTDKGLQELPEAIVEIFNLHDFIMDAEQG